MLESPNPPSESKLIETVDRLTRFASEDLARTVNRRSFLKRAGTAAFFALAGLATGQVFGPPKAAAAGLAPRPRLGKVPDPTPNCSPPGPYCNTGGGILTGCHGAHCFAHLYNGQVYACHVYYQYYPGGCWTSSGSGGYWTCCDCSCGQPQVATCGCAQFSGTPSPAPLHPVG